MNKITENIILGDLYDYLYTLSYNYFSHLNSSKPITNPFSNLNKLLLNKVLLNRSYDMCKNNAAPGYDGLTKKDIGTEVKAFIDEIYSELKSKSYSPSPLLKSRKPKRNGEGYRNLYIPTLKDKVVQRAFVQILNPINEAIFHNCNYAFRPNRNIGDAIRTLKTDLQDNQLHYVVKTDIKKCFHNLNKNLIMENLDFIEDRLFVEYIEQFLDVKIIDKDGSSISNAPGVPQGTVIGSLLSNVALHSIDTLWMSNHRKAGDLEMLRYADDMLFCMKYPNKDIISVADQMFDKLNLDRNIQKTKIINLRSGRPLRFLGYYIQMKRVKPLKLYIAPKKENISRLQKRLQKIIDLEINSEQEIANKVINNYSSFIKFYRESTSWDWLEDLKEFIRITLKYEGVMPELIIDQMKTKDDMLLY